jgi:hypothetical protein
MKVSRIGLTLAALAFTSTAMALPGFVKDFGSTYGIKKGGTLDKAKCAVCHVGMNPKKLNPYGEDLKKTLAEEKAGTLLKGSVLKKVEGLDSDKDGKKNIEEIRADTNPGDAKSK